MKGSALRSYLVQNQYSYCFRLRVPIDIQEIIGKKEIRYSLKTGYLGVAKKKAYLCAGLFWNLFDFIRNLRLKKMALSQENYEKLVEDCKLFIEFSMGQIWDEINNPADAAEWYGKLSAYLTRTKLDQIHGESKDIQDFLESMSSSNTDLTQIEKGSKQWNEFNRTLMQNYIQLLEQERDIIKKKFPELDLDRLYNANQDSRNDNPSPKKKTDKLISEVIPGFIDENKVKWKPKEERFARSALNFFKEYMEDAPIQSIERADVAQYKEIIKKLPAYKAIKPEYKGKAIIEVSKMEIEKTLSVGRINKYIGKVASLFQHAIDNGMYKGENPATRLQLPGDKWETEKRAPFTFTELERLFRSEKSLNDSFSRSYMFWTPILALFHGMREGEIAGLFLDDIKKSEDGVWYFDLFSRKSNPRTAQRVAPIHPYILDELKFISYADKLRDEGYDRLFPDCTKNKDGYGRNVSEWFNKRYKVKCGIVSPDNRLRDFHSFRTTFITDLRHKTVHDRMLKAVVGHSTSIDVTDRYTDPYPVKQLLDEVVSKVDFHKRIDLSHLKNSKWVVK